MTDWVSKGACHMSKKHLELHKLAGQILDFLTQVTELKKWEAVHGPLSTGESARLLDNASIAYEVRGWVNVSPGTAMKFHIQLVLSPHFDVDVYLVKLLEITRLEIHGNAPLGLLRSSQTVLEHYGKRFPNEADLTLGPLKDDLWKIDRPADLEALFNAYDHVAHLYGCVPVFNLPQ